MQSIGDSRGWRQARPDAGKVHPKLRLTTLVGLLDYYRQFEAMSDEEISAELRARAEELARDLGLTERYHVHAEDTKAGVDSVPFAEEGVPALSIVHFPYPEYHLPSERLELVDEQRLADSVELAVALVESQLEQPVAKA